MLHAFNQQNARRILPVGKVEHVNEKTEDSITSMVFSPLVFMPPSDALLALQAVVGPRGDIPIAGREVVGNTISFWPKGMKARSRYGEGLTSCTPDLVAEFRFTEGPKLVFVGEMKWDWRMGVREFEIELNREREAVRNYHEIQEPLMFVLAKHRQDRYIANVPIKTWEEVLVSLAPLARSNVDGPLTRWAKEVTTFLKLADVLVFNGFPCENTATVERWQAPTAFWKAGF